MFTEAWTNPVIALIIQHVVQKILQTVIVFHSRHGSQMQNLVDTNIVAPADISREREIVFLQFAKTVWSGI